MRKVSLLIALIPVLYGITSCVYSKNVKSFTHTAPESYIWLKHKNAIATAMGKDNSSKGLRALMANDLARVAKLAKGKLKKATNENDEDDKMQNSKYFIVARVGNEVITNVDIINAIRFVFFSSGRRFDRKYAKMMVKPVLDSIIDDKIRQQLARMQNIDIDVEVQNKIEEIAKTNKLTVDELGAEFKKSGINMLIFKRNISAKMIFSGFFQSMVSSMVVSPELIAIEKANYKKSLAKTRYKISEIFFRVENSAEQQIVRDKAESVTGLLAEGFDFQALSESISQSYDLGKNNDKEWIKAENIDKNILREIQNLSVGENTGVIAVRGGYKIVKLVDKAEANKAGISESEYKVVVAEIPTPAPKTESEAMSIQLSINTIADADNVEVFKRACEVYGFKMMETTITNPDAIQKELISRNKRTGKSGIIRVSENAPLVALFVISEKVPDAVLPSDKSFSDIIINRKAVQTFGKMMKRHHAMSYIKVYNDKLNEVIQ